MGNCYLALLIFLSAMAITLGLSIEPNHDKPCVVGDAWAEDCRSCVCIQGGVVSCKPTFCASRLRRALDDCTEGMVTSVDCNICKCLFGQRICTKRDCSHNTKNVD